MLYRNFIESLAKKTGLNQNQAMKMVDLSVRTIKDNLKNNKNINLGVFGTLENTTDAKGNTKISLANQESIILKTTIPKEQPKTDPEPPAPIQPITPDNSIPYIDLNKLTIPKEILEIIPENIAKKYQIVPIKLDGVNLTIAMVDPEDNEAIELLKKGTGFDIIPNICTRNDIAHALNQYSAIKEEIAEIVKDDTQKQDISNKKSEPITEELSEAAPASKIVNSLIKRAVRDRASDIHIEPTDESLETRFRIDGVLHKILNLPKEIQPAVISRIKILSTMKIDEQRMPQDGRFQTVIDGNDIDFRVSTLPTVNGEKVVMRILDKSAGLLTLKQLGLRDKAYETLYDSIKKPNGMILSTGPTGSGKTTTLYAMIDEIKNEAINIITLEDPVEYRMNGVNQSQVNSEIGYTFANGLRTILRQDPNVIMLGEIRDSETAEMAVQSALTGHVVLSTLHTNDAAGAIPRLIDMSIEPFLINSSVNVIIAQRLCRKICQNCREEIAITDQQIEEIKKQLGPLSDRVEIPDKLFLGKGCESCSQTGYKGRIGIFEILPLTPEIKAKVKKDVSTDEINQIAISQGMSTLSQDGINKAILGETTLEEVWRVTKN